MKRHEEKAFESFANDDLPQAGPALELYLSRIHLGEAKTGLTSEERHQIAAKLARQAEAKKERKS